jgi:hypothetical protein
MQGVLQHVHVSVKIIVPHDLWRGVAFLSEGQEKYFTGVIKKSLQWGVAQELFCMVKMRYFRGTGMIFPRLALL